MSCKQELFCPKFHTDYKHGDNSNQHTKTKQKISFAT